MRNFERTVDLWSELYKKVNLYVLDTRDKKTTKMGRKQHGSVPRMALDIKEAIEHYAIDEKNLVLFGASVGASYVMHAVGGYGVNPKSCILIGPSLKPKQPRYLVLLGYIIPIRLLAPIGRRLVKKWMSKRVNAGYQRDLYLFYFDEAHVINWKKCIRVAEWDATEDYKKATCTINVVITAADIYHETEKSEKLLEIAKNGRIIEVPDYEYMHRNPGVKQFTEQIMEIFQE